MAGVRRIPPATEKAVLDQYARGVSAAKLAAKHGIHRKTVTIIVRRNGGKVLDQRSASGRPMINSEKFVKRAAALRKAGMSHADISRKIGFCTDVVGRLLRRSGLTGRKPQLRMSGHGNWRGGVVKTGYGYLAQIMPEDWPWPGMCAASGYILQHRLVMARHLGRALTRDETVHHVNGVKTDNRPENLQVMHGKHGKGAAFVCRDCGSHNVAPRDI